MSKFRSLILIIGLTIIAVAAALLTVLLLYATGTIVTDPIELVYVVGSDSKYYDGTPLTLPENDYNLVSGDILEGHTAQVKIVGSQTNAGTSESTLEVKIFDKKGFDVTDQYAVKVNTGTLTVEQQNISVSIPDSKVVYNGKEVFFDKYDITEGSLARGHKIGAANASLMNVGKLPVDVKPVIYDAFDNDVTENYNVNFQAGEVEISPRPLVIKPLNITKIYDGIKVKAEEYEIVSGSIAPGQKAVYTITTSGGDEASFTECTEDLGTRIKFDTFKIVDETDPEGKSLLSNYECTLEAGVVVVERRALTIATATKTFTYDGEEHYDNTFQILSGSLAPNQKFTAANVNTVKTVAQGEVENELSFAFTTNEGKTVNEQNYLITQITGTLSVKPFELTVFAKSYTKEYDGAPLSDVMGDTYYELSVTLPEKFTLSAVCDSAVTDQVNAIAETPYSLDISIKINDEDCTENFNVNPREGKYSITKKPLTIQSASEAFEYDKQEHCNITDHKTTGLLEGHEVEDITEYTKVTDVEGNIPNQYYAYSIKDGDGNDVTGNYAITFIAGVLTVTPQHVDIPLSTTLTGTYDGNVYQFNKNDVFDGVDLSEYGMTTADFEIVSFYDIKNAGTHKYSAQYTGDSQNYDVSVTQGSVEIGRKDVTLTTKINFVEMNYSGYESYYANDAHIINNLEVDGHKVRTAVFEKDFETVKVVSVTVYDDTEGDLTGNYNITYNVTIAVTVKPASCQLNLTLGDYTPQYYQITAAGIIKCIRPEGLAEGDRLVIEEDDIDIYSTSYGIQNYKIMHGTHDVTEYYTSPDLAELSGNIILN